MDRACRKTDRMARLAQPGCVAARDHRTDQGRQKVQGRQQRHDKKPAQPAHGSVIVVGVVAVDLKPFVAVAAFDKTGVLGDRQPDAWVAQSATAPIAGDFPFGNDLGLWRGEGHGLSLGCFATQYRLAGAGQERPAILLGSVRNRLA
jgi:hypothetical protein